MTTLEDRLRSEARTCPCCNYRIVTPFTERCPRCLTELPEMKRVCATCAYNCGCPVSTVPKFQ